MLYKSKNKLHFYFKSTSEIQISFEDTTEQQYDIEIDQKTKDSLEQAFSELQSNQSFCDHWKSITIQTSPLVQQQNTIKINELKKVSNTTNNLLTLQTLNTSVNNLILSSKNQYKQTSYIERIMSEIIMTIVESLKEQYVLSEIYLQFDTDDYFIIETIKEMFLMTSIQMIYINGKLYDKKESLQALERLKDSMLKSMN